MIKKIKSISKGLHKKYGSKYLIIMSFICCMMVGIIGSFSIVLVEQNHPDASIKNFWNAMYWTFATMSTVGYGDFTPVTPAGKLIANIIMALGIGLYSFSISLITGFFIHDLMNKSTDTCELKEQNTRIEENQKLILQKLEELKQGKNK